MEATVLNLPFNPIQQHLLKMFSVIKREDDLKELQSVLFEYYKNKVTMQTDEFWENNHLDSTKIEAIMRGHNRISIQ
ncbi:hypothetical protein FACS1894199_04910 [Bacteroidia bacterium]|nr:hypothetical protein FACS1894195_4540 [Bacteroidia bacterium]GHV65088.1 hypothetical protein FACS1894199_04910 [Bacteroidia bacterium]